MHWDQVLTVIAVNMGLFLWNRVEARTDDRRSKDLIEAMRKDSKDFQQAMMNESKDFQQAMMNESKDFHGRLCAIEEKYYAFKLGELNKK